ncbi:DUF882 domain-containing protein [Shewanella youngdeokensis]|uniref:Murein endopeptidase K n=1 Tax=Shewanella youngdeokensis TaxID=2999068 RepID=A0ABZ0JTY3_9GAMM|nr:DUF882 domain-containing protein [Shewanella sp. DAU334]
MTVVCSARRQLLLGLGGVAMFTMLPQQVQASRSTKGVRSLGFYNRHTGERQQGSYWVDGDYQSKILTDFSQVLRDHRQNESAPMDKRLFDFAYKLKESLNFDDEFHVISGYRSPKTNAMLSSKSSGVAKKSYHMKGMALDLVVPGVSLAEVRRAAIALKLGGVGYYPKSGFVHIDTGPIRSW